MSARLWTVTASVIASNFAYQALGPHNWPVAIERSVFGLTMAFCIWQALYFSALLDSKTTQKGR